MAETTSSTNCTKRNNSDNTNNVLSKITVSYKNETIKEILKLNFQDGKTKINEDSAHLVNEVIKLMTTDAVLRASQLAEQEHKTTITADIIEAIIPQIV